jgi:hypothetical protein
MNYYQLEKQYNHFKDVLICLNINPEILHKLKRLDARYYNLSLNYCNGLIESDIFEKYTNEIEEKVKDLLQDRANRIKFNSDPRGNAFKIKKEYAKDTHIIRDWGGDGILFPEF